MSPVNIQVDTEPRHAIQVVARRTGLNSDLIRMWERRYAAVSPSRAANGRRLYSDADIERLALLRRVVDGGRRISDAVALSNGELQQLASEDRAAGAALEYSLQQARGAGGGEAHVQTCMAAIEALDAAELGAALNHAADALTLPLLLEEMVTPLITQVGQRWRAGTLRVANEHLATAELRRFLDQMRGRLNTGDNGPVLLVTTPPGQSHELGALMVAVTAAADGWNALYLGPNLPIADIAAGAAETDARAIALSLVYPPDDPHLSDELRRLQQQLPDRVALVMGGHSAPGYLNVIEEIGAFHCASLSDLRTTLESLRYTPVR